MWSAGSRVTDVYLGTRGFAVCESGAPAIASEVPSFDAMLNRLAQWLTSGATTRWPRRRLRLWLSGGLCRPFILPAIEGVENDAEFRTVATALAPQHTGLAGPCAVLLERVVGHAPMVAVAVQEDQIRSIRDRIDASSRSVRLVSIRPWWAEVLRHGLVGEPTLTALGVQDCDSLTVLIGKNVGRFDTAATYSPVMDQSTARTVLRRALFSADVTEGSELFGRLTLRHVAGADKVAAGMALSALTEFSR